MSKSVPDNLMRARYRKVRVNGRQMNLHRHVMELKLGRPLLPHEVVHHINGNKFDNRPENLMVLTSSAHSHLELTGKKLSDEHKAKVSASLVGNQRRRGVPHTPEIKAKLSDATRKARANKFWSTKKK